MSTLMENLKEQAKKEFLGRGTVVGVGVTDEGGEKLVFLLEQESPRTRRHILNWARQHSVKVLFLVTGRIRRALGHI